MICSILRRVSLGIRYHIDRQLPRHTSSISSVSVASCFVSQAHRAETVVRSPPWRRKKKRVPTPTASARTKPPSETAARGKLIDVWKGTTPIECFSCHQKTRSLDRNAPPSKPKYVYWLQAKWKNGKRQPVGRECYSCYKVRRRNFPTLSQEELCEKRKEKVVDDKFWELRADLVGERNELKAEGHVSIQLLILKSKETFGERFVTGTFVPLGEFAEKRRLKYEDEDTLGKLIAAKYPEYEVVTDANGVLGVEILDQTGSEYKFKRGARESTRLMKKKTFASKADAEEDFAMSVAKTEQKADLARARSAHEVGCGSPVESGEMPKRETSPSIEPRSSRHSRAISEAASGLAASVASEVKSSTPRKGMAVAALRRPGPASRKRLLAKQCHVERDDDEGSHADDEDDDHPGCEESERKTSAERTLCSAEDVLAKSLAYAVLGCTWRIRSRSERSKRPSARFAGGAASAERSNVTKHSDCHNDASTRRTPWKSGKASSTLHARTSQRWSLRQGHRRLPA